MEVKAKAKRLNVSGMPHRVDAVCKLIKYDNISAAISFCFMISSSRRTRVLQITRNHPSCESMQSIHISPGIRPQVEGANSV